MQVKRDEPGLKGSRQNHALGELVRTKILDQIGTELLCECSGSYFSPGAVGILCLRSQVITIYYQTSYRYFQSGMILAWPFNRYIKLHVIFQLSAIIFRNKEIKRSLLFLKVFFLAKQGRKKISHVFVCNTYRDKRVTFIVLV